MRAGKSCKICGEIIVYDLYHDDCMDCDNTACLDCCSTRFDDDEEDENE